MKSPACNCRAIATMDKQIKKPKKVFNIIKITSPALKQLQKKATANKIKSQKKLSANLFPAPAVISDNQKQIDIKGNKESINEILHTQLMKKVLQLRLTRYHVSCPYCKSPLLVKNDSSLIRHYTKCAAYFKLK